MRDRRSGALTGALVALALTASACSQGSVTNLTAPPTTDPGATLGLIHTPAGSILATGNGNALYDFVPDTPTHSACTDDGCVFQWPPLTVNGPIRVGPGVNRSLLTTLKRPDGSIQLAYGGHPLYTYNLDVKPGMVTGQAIDQNGGPWYVLNAAGHEVHTAFSING